MAKLKWKKYTPEILTSAGAGTYVLRLAEKVSDLEPTCIEVYGDDLLVVNGHYNKRGYCVGYSLHYTGSPATLRSDFYLVLDYVAKDKEPGAPTYPKLAKKNPKVCLVKFGTRKDKRRMYTFIYRKKRDG